MMKVMISGWEKGLNKVELNHLLRVHARFGLGEAKRAVDQLIAGQAVSFLADDENVARSFCSSAKLIGADCSYVLEEVPNASFV